MRSLIPILAIVAISLCGCGGSSPMAAPTPPVAGTYTARTPHTSTTATIVDVGGGEFTVVFQPTGINTSPITGTVKAGQLGVSDDGVHSLFLFTDSDGRLWLDVDHVRYALSVSA